MATGLEIPGDLPWLVLLASLIAIAWHVGVLKQSAARRGILAGAGVALLGIPVVAAGRALSSFPTSVWVAVFYGPVVTVVLFVWLRDASPSGFHPRLSR